MRPARTRRRSTVRSRQGKVAALAGAFETTAGGAPILPTAFQRQQRAQEAAYRLAREESQGRLLRLTACNTLSLILLTEQEATRNLHAVGGGVQFGGLHFIQHVGL